MPEPYTVKGVPMPNLLQVAADGSKEEWEVSYRAWLTRGWRRIFRGAEGGPRD